MVGYVGRFDPVKNLPALLRAFAALRGGERGRWRRRAGWHWSAMQDCKKSALRWLAISLHIAPQVHFMGATDVPEKWYKSFSVLCLPSAVEGFGLTLVEAMAAGVPVVAIKTPVTAEIVRDGVDGRLVDVGSLGMALQEVMDSSLLPPHGPTDPHKPSLQWVEARFSVERMVGAHAEFFKNLLAAHH